MLKIPPLIRIISPDDAITTSGTINIIPRKGLLLKISTTETFSEEREHRDATSSSRTRFVLVTLLSHYVRGGGVE